MPTPNSDDVTLRRRRPARPTLPAAPLRRRGFTLVELLVVIAIIGILVSLLLPAVQAARESARRAQCTNHLKQLALAWHNHHAAHARFPSGGWGWFWVGDPDRGSGREQPGGWAYSLLPYLEQQALHDLGSDGQPDAHTTAQLDGAARRQQTPLAVQHCPSRRPARAWPVSTPLAEPYGSALAPLVARGDYAACAGDQRNPWSLSGPSRLADAIDPGYGWPDMNEATGVSFLRSEVRISDVRDGTTNTYLMGEKYLSPDGYTTGEDGGDNVSLYSGYGGNHHRTTHYDPDKGVTNPPLQDRRGAPNSHRFGSAHAGGFNVALADGSVRNVSYAIDLETHRRLGNRADGQVVDAGRL